MYSDDDTTETSELDQPLFQELNDSHYRESAYGGPYGVLVGGAALPATYELSIQYLRAADILVESIRRQEAEDFTLANPLLFLYRHSVEMLLKSRLRDRPQTHDLNELLEAYRAEVRSEYACEVPNWVVARIGEIAEIDRNSTSFRYGETRGRVSRRQVPVDGEMHVYIEPLQRVVRALHSALNDEPHFRHDQTVPWEPD